MGVLNKQITVSKQAYEKRLNIPMSQSLQDAFNDILSNFSETEIDKSYESEMNQFLKNDNGDVYYFDNFKYVFPKEIGKQNDIRVLNNNIGRDQFSYVKYNGQSIIVENYDVRGNAEITSYLMTDETMQLISGEMNGDFGDFLLQVSVNNNAYSQSLHIGSKIVVRKEDDNLVSYDNNGDVIDSVPSNSDYSQSQGVNSFFRELESKVNYYGLLDSTYSLTQKSNSEENKGPRR